MKCQQWAIRLGLLQRTPISDVGDGLQAARPDGFRESLVVPFVLVGVTLGEVGDRPIELVALAQVLGQGYGVTGPGVGPGQRPTADTGVEPQARGVIASTAAEPFMSRSCASRDSGWLRYLWSNPGRCRWPPASSAGPERRVRRAA